VLVRGLDEAYKNGNASVANPLSAGSDKSIVPYDPEFNWKSSDRENKYLGGYVVYLGDEAKLKKNTKQVKEKLKEFTTELASLSQAQIEAMRTGLRPPASYWF
jgi:hypothetical protein